MPIFCSPVGSWGSTCHDVAFFFWGGGGGGAFSFIHTVTMTVHVNL